MDVGARANTAACYQLLRRLGLAKVTAFEPDPQADVDADVVVRKAAWSDEGFAALHVCASPYMSSLLAPDARRLALYGPEMAEWGRQVGERMIETARLDDTVKRADWLCVDVQGGEWDVLSGATELLRRVLVVQVEVAFQPIYVGQVPFGDVDDLLRDYGLVPWRFGDVVGRSFGGGSGVSLLDGDMVYVRDPLADMSERDCYATALIAHYGYSGHDLARHRLHEAAPELAEEYQDWWRWKGGVECG